MCTWVCLKGCTVYLLVQVTELLVKATGSWGIHKNCLKHGCYHWQSAEKVLRNLSLEDVFIYSS